MSNDMQRCSKAVQRKLRKSITSKGFPLSHGSKNGNATVFVRKTKTASLKEDFQCLCQKHCLENFTALKEILPENYDYRVCSFSQDGDGFKATLRLPSLSPEKAQEWKNSLENVSFCIFRVCRTFPGSGRYNIFKMDYACQHNMSRGAGKLASKKTGCKAELSLTVKRVVKKSRSRDKHLPEYPTCIFIRWCHNHALDALQSLRYRDVGEDTMQEFIALYHRGYTPASAYSSFKTKLMSKWGNNFETVSKDRRILPEKQYVYRLFAKLKKKKSDQGASSVESFDPIFDALCHKVEMDVILPAAGSSTRMGRQDCPKPYIKVLGSHIIAYTINCFHKVPWVRHIVLIVSADRLESAKNLVQSYNFSKVRVCEGSHTRHRSIYRGVQALRNECNDSSVVVIHDGARPFVSEDIIEKVASAAEKHGAAGVVRPLVSTVVKGSDSGMLEMSLKRSDYRNSEMPQGFQYGVIAGAYTKCSEEDFDHGTECLLLALKYSQCSAQLLEGDDHLWKVTYQKDIPLMESAIKVKYTKVCLIEKLQHPLKCMEQFRSDLHSKGFQIVSSEKEGANTIVCFLDLPSTLTTASVKGETYSKQFEALYSRLPNSVTKLNLMVIAVFVKSGLSQSPSIASTSFQNPVPSSQLPNLQELPPHQQQQSSQQVPPVQQYLPPSLHPHQQQEQHNHPYRLPGNMHQAISLSSASCPQTLQETRTFVSRSDYKYSGNMDTSYPTTPYSFDNKNSQVHLPYPPVPVLSLPQPTFLPHPSHPNPPLPLPVSSSPPQSFNICQEISFSDLQSPQNIFESHLNEGKDRSIEKCYKGPTAQMSKELESPILSYVQDSSSDIETGNSDAPVRNSDTDLLELKLSHRFMSSVEKKMRKSNISSCLVGVRCEDGGEVIHKLLDLVWGRNQFLNGQVLSFL